MPLASKREGRTLCLREIRIFPEVGGSSVLWEAQGVDINPSAADLGLSASLTAALDDWYAFWSEHADPFLGWDSASNEHDFLHTGEFLREAVQIELGVDFVVSR